MSLKPSDTVVNDLPSTGNDEFDKLITDLAEIGLAGFEGHNWQGYASAPLMPVAHWQPVARKVMTVETAVLIVHLCHLHAVHRAFVVSALDKYRDTVNALQQWAATKVTGKLLSRFAPAVLLKGFTAALGWIQKLVAIADDVELYRALQLKIRRQGLAGRQDAIDPENFLSFGKAPRPRETRVVSTRK